MNVEAIAFTQAGLALGERLIALLAAQGVHMRLCCGRKGGVPLKDWTAQHFDHADALLFIGAAGIAVRAIAPHVKSKEADPAVVVVDEGGRFAIPLLSGHIGGANRLAARIAALIGATAVHTTATDGRRLFAVDTWAAEQGLAIANPQRIVDVSSALLDGKRIALYSEFPIEGTAPKGIDMLDGLAGAQVILSHYSQSETTALWLVPRAVVAGIGCRRGVAAEAIAYALEAALDCLGIAPMALRKVCSIDIKAQEAGLVDYCRSKALLFQTFSADALRAVQGDFTPSAFVQGVTGVDNVCERSAVLGSGGALLSRKEIYKGVTVALALCPPQLSFDNKEALS